jgi:hypothetical protein
MACDDRRGCQDALRDTDTDLAMALQPPLQSWGKAKIKITPSDFPSWKRTGPRLSILEDSRLL